MAGVLQHLRSSTLNKRPNPSSMVDGQVAINYASGAPGMFFKDSNGALVKVGPVHVGSGAPNAVPASGGTAGNSLGEQWLDTSGGTYVFKIWDGSAWRSEAGEFVNVTGDTMTGALGIIAGSASSPSLFFSGDTNTGLYSPGADQVAISTNSSQRLLIDASGRVGINTASPASFLTTYAGNVSTLGAKASTGLLVENNGSVGNVSQIGLGYTFSSTYHPVSIAALTTSGAGSTRADLVFAIRDLTTDVAPTERMRLDSSGRLGLGTSTANGLLHIGTADVRAILLNNSSIGTNAGDGTYISNKTDGSFAIINQENSSLTLGTNNTDRLHITAGGAVGIGNTGPGSYNAGFNQLVVGSSGDQGVTIVSGTSNSGTIAFADGTSGADAYRGYVQYQHGSTNALVFATDGSERFRCDSSGRVLVGTSSYAGNGRLIAAGNTGGNAGTLDICWTGSRPTAADTDIGYIRWYSVDNSSSNAHYAHIYASSDGASSSGSDIPGRLVFSVTGDGDASPTERMRIVNDGNVLVYGNGNGVAAKSSQGAGSTFAVFVGAHSASSTTTGTNSFLVYTNGNVQNTNNSYAGISDLKLKENIVEAGSQWGDLKALRVVNYNFKPETNQETHKQIGLIAQEVELVSPGLVSESPDRDAEGNDLGTVTKSVNYSVLYMKAVKALQEAMERIETLEAKVAALEAS